MIKLVLSGLWVCLVTLASTYAAVFWHTARVPAGDTQKLFGGLESVRTRMISVPVVADGAVHGYVMAQFIFTADANAMKRMTVKPDVFLLDEAFKTIYGNDRIDFRSVGKQDLPALSKEIAANVNKRLGVSLINDVLIQELNYVSKEDVRDGGKKR
jgi:hypothetical protein